MNRADLVAHWQLLTTPSANITNSKQREQSQLLASLMLATVILGLLSSPLTVILNPGMRWAQVHTIVGLIDTLLAYVAYRMARQGDYLLASTMIALAGTIIISLGAFMSGGDAGLHLFYFFSIMTLFASMFLPKRTVAVISIMQYLAMLGYGWFGAEMTIQAVINGPLLFNVLLLFTALILVRHRDQLTRHQKTRLAESEMRYRTVADLATDYAYSFRVDPDGTLTPEWFTDSYFKLTGYSRDELDPNDAIKHYHPDDQSAIRTHQRMVAEGTPHSGEYRLIGKDGRVRWVQLACRPVWDETGKHVERIFGVGQDITERKETEMQRLEIALAEVRADLLHGFFRQVAHDFRTSLSVISTSRYMIQQYLQRGDTKQVETNLEKITQQVDRLNQQIENLRVVSRLNNPTTEPCDLNAIARKAIEDHQEAILAKNLQCGFVPDPTVPPVHAHPRELQRAIGLLLDNGIQYNRPGGAITIRVGYENDLSILDVSDMGIGVPPEDETRIFEFFYRAENAIEHQPDGYGLGLSVARMITEAYGGQITVTSSLGEGSTFRMRFPTLPIMKKDPLA